jgi:anaerobic selenocysteine-containing dehydrogenase
MAGLQQGDRQVRGACALDCPDTCSWIVTVKGGQPVALRGDPDHPYTRGSLCNKVADYLAYARSSDRLLHPMRRVGPKGSGAFTRISWDEALERVAAGLGDVIAKHGAEAIWPFVGSGNLGLIQGIYGAGRRLWNVLGTSRHVVTICTIAGGFGTGYTLDDNRVGMDPETLRFSKLVVLWGAADPRGAEPRCCRRIPTWPRDSKGGGGAVYHDNRVRVDKTSDRGWVLP